MIQLLYNYNYNTLQYSSPYHPARKHLQHTFSSAVLNSSFGGRWGVWVDSNPCRSCALTTRLCNSPSIPSLNFEFFCQFWKIMIFWQCCESGSAGIRTFSSDSDPRNIFWYGTVGSVQKVILTIIVNNSKINSDSMNLDHSTQICWTGNLDCQNLIKADCREKYSW